MTISKPAWQDSHPQLAHGGRGRLLQVLGVGFGVAVTVGNTIGAGIFRAPGEVAAHLPDTSLFLAAWTVGGVYALLGALQIADSGRCCPFRRPVCLLASRARRIRRLRCRLERLALDLWIRRRGRDRRRRACRRARARRLPDTARRSRSASPLSLRCCSGVAFAAAA